MKVHPFVVGLVAMLVIASERQALADDRADPSDNRCHWVATAATAPYSDVLRGRVGEAIARNDWQVIRGLIWEGADPDWMRHTKWYKRALRESLNRDLLHASAIGDDHRILKLIREGADVNVKAHFDDYMSPLTWAARCDHASAVRLLLDKRADVDITGEVPGNSMGSAEGSTPLIWAARFGNVDVVKILLAKGANPNAQETVIFDINKPAEKQKGNTPLVEAANKETTELLLRSKADPNLAGVRGISPLMNAAFRGDLEQCKLLLVNGASPRLKDRDGQTAADWAEQAKHMIVAKLLRSLE